MEEQVFFPGPYDHKPWVTVKPEDLSSGKSAGSADCAGGSSSGKRVRRRSVKGDEFDKQRVEIQRNRQCGTHTIAGADGVASSSFTS